MNLRSISSPFWGWLGDFYPAGRRDLWRNKSGRVYLLGNGRVGGKGLGTIFLDRLHTRLDLPTPERSLIVCEDYFGLSSVDQNDLLNLKDNSRNNLIPHEELAPEKVANLIREIELLGIGCRIALRSSSVIEDNPKQTFAGRFGTEWLTKSLTDHFNPVAFQTKLLDVLNSNYSTKAALAYRLAGLDEIPPLPLVIQAVIGQEWKYAPGYFFPALAGIINTAGQNVIKIAAVAGLGLAAVEGQGMLFTTDRQSLATTENIGALKALYFLDLAYGTLSSIRQNRQAMKLFEPFNLFQAEALFLFKKLHPLLVDLGLKLEDQLGLPIDAEWALNRNREQVFLQVRPLKALKPIVIPDVPAGNIVIQSTEVLGQEKRPIKHLMFIEEDAIFPLRFHRKEFIKKYPDTLVVLQRRVTSSIDDELLECIFPFSNNVFIFDAEQAHYRDGLAGNKNGIDHFSLNCRDLNVMLMYTGKRYYDFCAVNPDFELVERLESFNNTINLYRPRIPLTLVADQGQKLGMLYFDS